VGERYIQVRAPDNGRVPFPSIIIVWVGGTLWAINWRWETAFPCVPLHFNHCFHHTLLSLITTDVVSTVGEILRKGAYNLQTYSPYDECIPPVQCSALINAFISIQTTELLYNCNCDQWRRYTRARQVEWPERSTALAPPCLALRIALLR